MGYYKIGDYILQFNYTPDNQLINERIQKFTIDYHSQIDFFMSSQIVKKINIPDINPIIEYKGKKLYKISENQYVMCIGKDDINVRIDYDTEYKYVKVELHERFGDNVYEQEYILTSILFSSMMATKGIISLHASAISYNNDAILFSASSGTGKSTHAMLWKKYKDNVLIVNDDKALIRSQNNVFEFVGCPWSGKTPQTENIIVPLKAICFISQGKENKVRSLSNQEKLLFVLQNVFRPLDEKIINNVLSTISILIEKIPMYHLECDISQTAVETIYNKIYHSEEYER